MEIYNKTGVTTSGKIEVKKGFASLVICSSSPLSGTESITLKVQRKMGLETTATDIPLRAYALLGTTGKDAIQYNPLLGHYAVVELTEGEINPNISLNGLDNEIITIEMNGLQSATTYSLNTLESSFDDDEAELYKLFQRVIAPTTLQENIDTRGFDAMVIDRSSDIKNVVLTYDNNKRVELTPKEVDFLSASSDPFQTGLKCSITPENTIFIPTALDSAYHLIDLVGIINVELNKSAGSEALNVIMKIDESDAELYNVKR